MHTFFFRLPLYSQFISMWVIVYCPFLHSLALCLPTGCAVSIWVPVWEMIPVKCDRAKHFHGRKEFIRSIPFPSCQNDGSQGSWLHRQLKHPLDLQVCDVPHYGKHSNTTPPRANARHISIAWAEEEQSFHPVHINGDIWGESSTPKLG